MKKKSTKAEAERARKEAWLAKSRLANAGASVGDVPAQIDRDPRQQTPAGHRIGDS